MRFTILPAVDIADGRIVRSGSGADEGALDDPLLVALAWQADGAEWIHLVDIDSAFGRGSNSDLLASMVGKLDVAVELAGGIRDEASLDRALRAGSERVVLSTAALRDRSWCSRVISTHGERIAVGLDVRVDRIADTEPAYRLAARGAPGDEGDLWATLDWLESAGATRYVVTDVTRDASLSGPNVELCRAVAGAISSPVIASGGVSSVDDLVALAQSVSDGPTIEGAIEGAIVGAALHAGRFTLVEALGSVR